MSNLKAIRERVGMTQSALASAVEMTQGAIAHYENGRRQPGLSECRKLVEALNKRGANCTLDDVFPQPSSQPAPLSAVKPDRRARLTTTDRRGRRVTDPTEAEIKALRESAEKPLEVADRLAG